jgi:antitoxin (DNA-binding transcriptional repressor) of toxin-antitoxin stability system
MVDKNNSTIFSGIVLGSFVGFLKRTCILVDCNQKIAKTIDKIVRIVYNKSTRKGSDFMSITATELKNNLGKYLLLSATEDIFITKNGKVVAKLVNPHQNRVETAKSLFGILPKDANIEATRAERLNEK